ncbi:hypothetical protein KXV77_008742, partial [Aspergillus fumigatus]
MGDFRGFIHGLVTAAREILGYLCMQDHAQMPAIPWTALYNDPSQSQAGWNFVQDARTQWPVDGTHWMIDRLRAEPAMQRHFMRGGRFHPSAIQQYWQRVAQFKEKLAIFVHVTAGQPARAPELLSIQHCNTANSRRRNIYIEDGMVTFVTAYHKGFHASNDVKIIHRYVPREVGELVVWYIWLVMPFIDQLAAWQAAQAAQGSRATQGSHGLQGNQAAQGHHDMQGSQAAQGHHGMQGSQTAQGSQAAQGDHGTQGSRAAQGNQAMQAWLWGPDPGTGREWSSERFREA